LRHETPLLMQVQLDRGVTKSGDGLIAALVRYGERLHVLVARGDDLDGS
jgi:hypothetical protein